MSQNNSEELEKLKKKVENLKDLLKRTGKLGMQWEKYHEDVVENLKSKFPTLKSIPANDIKTDSTRPHILIEADNFDALTVLNYTHKGLIDVIYIDPPFNTGAQDWKYNNKIIDENDAYPHSKWLSLMYHRLKIAKDLLSPTGILCCAIDDYEAPRLWMLLDKIFGRKNHLGTAIIRTIPAGRKTDTKLALAHEYAIFYGRTEKAIIQKAPMGDRTRKIGKDFVKDPQPNIPLSLPGLPPQPDEYWLKGQPVRKTGTDSYAEKADGSTHVSYYPIYYDPDKPEYENIYFDKTGEPTEIEILPTSTDGTKRIWRLSKDKIQQYVKEGKVYYWETSNGPQIYYKMIGQAEVSDLERPKTIWDDSKFSASEYGTKLLQQDLENRVDAFSFPKSPYTVEECIRIANPKDDAIILDFFAGSGTTGRAVMQLNEKDDGQRRFILCTNNDVWPASLLKSLQEQGKSEEEIEEYGICRSVTYPRIKNLINGYEFTGEVKTELYSVNLTMTELKRMSTHFEKIKDLESTTNGQFSTYTLNRKNGTLFCHGIKQFTNRFDGYAGNLKYFRLDKNTKADETHLSLNNLAKNSTELICLKEDCFEKIKDENDYKIFTNYDQTKYLGIIYNSNAIEKMKEEINNIQKDFSIYVFSLFPTTPEFANVSYVKKEESFPIPIYKTFDNIRTDMQDPFEKAEPVAEPEPTDEGEATT